MDISYDDFIQTTEERHTKVVSKKFSKSFWIMEIFIKVNMKVGIVHLVNHFLQKHN